MIIDFHSHVLPSLDDGSRDVQMSLEMLRETARQAIEVCVATPHFYGDRQSMDDYLMERSNACNKLYDVLSEADFTPPMLLLGSEVAYFPGISRAKRLQNLCIAGTDLLLIEMPYKEWDTYVYSEIRSLSTMYRLILAHTERYLDLRGNAEWIMKIAQLPLTIQINAHSVCGWLQKRKIEKAFPGGFVLGSDMHDLAKRPQNLARGREALGDRVLARIDALGESLLKTI